MPKIKVNPQWVISKQEVARARSLLVLYGERVETDLYHAIDHAVMSRDLRIAELEELVKQAKTCPTP